MTSPTRLAVTLTVVAVLAAATAAHSAARYYASNLGTDGVSCGGTSGGGCGTKADPCRSISCAVLRAVDGDDVIVGPGIYGDIVADGVLDDPGEEGCKSELCFFCDCLVKVDKAVRIVSSDGAGATVISANVPLNYTVLLQADGAQLGLAGKGFTIIGTGYTVESAAVAISAGDVAVRGNQVDRAEWESEEDTGILARDAAGPILIEGNQVTEWSDGIVVDGGGPATVRKNQVTRNTRGISVTGTGNVAVGNVVVRNGTGIIVMSGGAATGNAAIGNIDAIQFLGGSGPITRNNIFGSLQCGLNVLSGNVVATSNFWGAASGPGADPADTVCLSDGASADLQPFASKPYPVKAVVKP